MSLGWVCGGGEGGGRGCQPEERESVTSELAVEPAAGSSASSPVDSFQVTRLNSKETSLHRAQVFEQHGGVL